MPIPSKMRLFAKAHKTPIQIGALFVVAAAMVLLGVFLSRPTLITAGFELKPGQTVGETVWREFRLLQQNSWIPSFLIGLGASVWSVVLLGIVQGS